MDRLTEAEINDLHRWLAAHPGQRRAFAIYARALYAVTGLPIFLEVLDILSDYAPLDPSPDYKAVES